MINTICIASLCSSLRLLHDALRFSFGARGFASVHYLSNYNYRHFDVKKEGDEFDLKIFDQQCQINATECSTDSSIVVILLQFL